MNIMNRNATSSGGAREPRATAAPAPAPRPRAWLSLLALLPALLGGGGAALAASLLDRPAAPPKETGEADNRLVAGIMDNSFLVEEAYNQEPGVVQHIWNVFRTVDRLPGADEHSWNLSFTQEWPVGSQRHQFSYTLPYSLSARGGSSRDGLGDVLLHYRFQAYYDDRALRGFAPRFSLVLPTGNAARGFGDDTLGYQWNLPISTAIGDRWFAHANAGLTYLPGAGTGPRYDLVHYNLGASAIYAATRRFHFMLEWTGVWEQAPDANGNLERELAAVVLPGARYAFDFANDAQLVIGLGAPIGLTRAAPDFGVLFYLSFEHRFRRAQP
jgi:hypothetical protein